MSGQLRDPAALRLNKKLRYIRAGVAGESHRGGGSCTYYNKRPAIQEE